MRDVKRGCRDRLTIRSRRSNVFALERPVVERRRISGSCLIVLPASCTDEPSLPPSFFPSFKLVSVSRGGKPQTPAPQRPDTLSSDPSYSYSSPSHRRDPRPRYPTPRRTPTTERVNPAHGIRDPEHLGSLRQAASVIETRSRVVQVDSDYDTDTDMGSVRDAGPCAMTPTWDSMRLGGMPCVVGRRGLRSMCSPGDCRLR
jgi:hypothetical protein